MAPSAPLLEIEKYFTENSHISNKDSDEKIQLLHKQYFTRPKGGKLKSRIIPQEKKIRSREGAFKFSAPIHCISLEDPDNLSDENKQRIQQLIEQILDNEDYCKNNESTLFPGKLYRIKNDEGEFEYITLSHGIVKGFAKYEKDSPRYYITEKKPVHVSVFKSCPIEKCFLRPTKEYPKKLMRSVHYLSIGSFKKTSDNKLEIKTKKRRLKKVVRAIKDSQIQLEQNLYDKTHSQKTKKVVDRNPIYTQETNDTGFIIMPFFEGNTIFSYYISGEYRHFRYGEMQLIFIKILENLIMLRLKNEKDGIPIHADLHDGNIIYSPEDGPKIIDFDLSGFEGETKKLREKITLGRFITYGVRECHYNYGAIKQFKENKRKCKNKPNEYIAIQRRIKDYLTYPFLFKSLFKYDERIIKELGNFLKNEESIVTPCAHDNKAVSLSAKEIFNIEKFSLSLKLAIEEMPTKLAQKLLGILKNQNHDTVLKEIIQLQKSGYAIILPEETNEQKKLIQNYLHNQIFFILNHIAPNETEIKNRKIDFEKIREKDNYPDVTFQLGALTDEENELEEIRFLIQNALKFETNPNCQLRNLEDTILPEKKYEAAKEKLKTLFSLYHKTVSIPKKWNQNEELVVDDILQYEKFTVCLNIVELKSYAPTKTPKEKKPIKLIYERLAKLEKIIKYSKEDNESTNSIKELASEIVVQINNIKSTKQDSSINTIKKICLELLGDENQRVNFLANYAIYQQHLKLVATEIYRTHWDTHHLGIVFNELYSIWDERLDRNPKKFSFINKSHHKKIKEMITNMINNEISKQDNINECFQTLCMALLMQLKVDVDAFKTIIEANKIIAKKLEMRYQEKHIANKQAIYKQLKDNLENQYKSIEKLSRTIDTTLNTENNLLEETIKIQAEYDQAYENLHKILEENNQDIINFSRPSMKPKYVFYRLTRPLSRVLAKILKAMGERDRYEWDKYGFQFFRPHSYKRHKKMFKETREGANKSRCLSASVSKTIQAG